MKKDNESPYRYYRVVGAKKIDQWFYEEGDSRRTHAKIYELVILPLFGICQNSFLDYRNASEELLEVCPQPAYIEVMLWLSAVLIKHLGPSEANRFALRLQTYFRKAVAHAHNAQSERAISADRLQASLILSMMKDKVPDGVQ